MNVIIYLIFAGSLPPPLSVLQVNQYSRPRSESSPSSSAHPHSRSHTCYPAASVIPRLSLFLPFLTLFFLFPPFSSTLKVHRHYFRRNRRTSIRRVEETSHGTTRNSNDCYESKKSRGRHEFH